MDISSNIFFSKKLNEKVENELVGSINKPIVNVSKVTIEKNGMMKIKRFDLVQNTCQILGEPRDLSNNFFKTIENQRVWNCY